MEPETLFQITNPLALLGWLALVVAPVSPKVVDWVSGVILPATLCLAYTILMLVHFADAPGGFQTLADVQLLFTDPDVALAGWLHFLAFDLFIGAWVVRHARAIQISHWAILPILPFIFLLGPAGLLAYFGLLIIMRRKPLLTAGEA